MMRPPTDQELLERFRHGRDQEALGEIVRRYIGLVHSAARRQVRDAHLAADITQAVFIVLVRKADSIGRDAILPAWLFTVTRHAVANARRMLARRRFHETQMASLSPPEPAAPPADASAELADEIRSVLDDGIAHLSSVERSSLLMHFFGEKTHKQVGEALGLSEDAARKRIARGLEKLRTYLSQRRGATASGTAIASVLAAERAAGAAVASQVSLISSTANLAVLADSVGAPAISTVTRAIAQGAARTIRASRVKLAAAVGVAALLLLCVTSMLAYAKRTASSSPPRHAMNSPQAARAPGVTAPTSQPDYSIALSDGATVRFLGASPFPADEGSWFSADGRAIELPDARLLNVNLPTAVPPNYEVALRIEHAPPDGMRLHVAGAVAGANEVIRDGDATILVCVFTLMGSPDSANLELGIANSRWKTVATHDRPRESQELVAPQIGPVSFEPVVEEGRGATVIARHRPFEDPHQIIAIDQAGKEHLPTHIAVQTLGPTITTACTFDLPPQRIAKAAFQIRPFTRLVQIQDVALRAGNATHPQLSVRDLNPAPSNR
jgi:RNA polymerase sigma factor (sigma-70 family)